MAEKISGKVRLAIIGCGGISAGHAGGILALPDQVECVAVCDVSKENMDARAAQLGVEAKYEDWRKMLDEMGDQIDAVDICLPHTLHAPCILDAIAAGKHILCEKPMCITMDDADKIVAAVADSGITYMSAHNQLFFPPIQAAKEVVASGEIGRVQWLRSQDCHAPPATAFAGSWRADAETQGGGVLIDTGYHPTYRLLYLAGSEVVGVRASMSRFRLDIGGEDAASVQVRFANGAIGEILTAWAFPLPYGSPMVHVLGDKGQVIASRTDITIIRDGETEPEVRECGQANAFAAQMAHFADCLQNGTQPIHGAEEGRTVLDVILQASADAGDWAKFAPHQV